MKKLGEYPHIIVDEYEGDIHFNDDITQVGGKHIVIPAPVATAVDAVVEAARDVETWHNTGKCYLAADVCIKIKQALTALDALQAGGKEEGGDG